MKKFTHAAATLCLALSATSVLANPLFSLDNLERERAAYLKSHVNPDLTSEQLELQRTRLQTNLIDLERMVIRDQRLLNSGDPRVTRALAAYDTTFLIHSAAEKDANPFAHWLAQVNVTQAAIRNSEKGVR